MTSIVMTMTKTPVAIHSINHHNVSIRCAPEPRGCKTDGAPLHAVAPRKKDSAPNATALFKSPRFLLGPTGAFLYPRPIENRAARERVSSLGHKAARPLCGG